MNVTNHKTAVRAVHKAACEMLMADLASYTPGCAFELGLIHACINALSGIEKAHPELAAGSEPPAPITRADYEASPATVRQALVRAGVEIIDKADAA